jgi:cytochrome c peroxidase
VEKDRIFGTTTLARTPQYVDKFRKEIPKTVFYDTNVNVVFQTLASDLE